MTDFDHRVVDMEGNPVPDAPAVFTPADVIEWLRNALNDFESGIGVSFGLQQQQFELQSARINALESLSEAQDKRISALEVEVLKKRGWWQR